MNHHRPRRAWILAFGYFAVCWLVAAWTGALDLVPGTIDAGSGSGSVLLAAVSVVAAFVGYWLIWPLGTETQGRPRRVGAAPAFGLIHGVSEGVLYIAMWRGVRPLLGADWAVVVVTLVLIGAYNGLWRTFIWDVWVTPPHNIDSWNLRKIVLVHVPVLALALTHLTLFQSGAVFLAVQSVALVGSAVHMRFPSPADPAVVD